jgi:uncharacterized protein (TIGR02145 family)
MISDFEFNAISIYLNQLAKNWWNTQLESRDTATCDACSFNSIRRNSGYLIGSNIHCEDCFNDKAVPMIKRNPDSAGVGILEKALNLSINLETDICFFCNNKSNSHYEKKMYGDVIKSFNEIKWHELKIKVPCCKKCKKIHFLQNLFFVSGGMFLIISLSILLGNAIALIFSSTIVPSVMSVLWLIIYVSGSIAIICFVVKLYLNSYQKKKNIIEYKSLIGYTPIKELTQKGWEFGYYDNTNKVFICTDVDRQLNKKAKSNTATKSGKEQNFFIDERDGNQYKIIKIGNQIMMAENLRYKMPNGSWVYDNNEENAIKYGYLYDWETAKKAVHGLYGWHLPTEEEWKSLYQYLGDNAIKVYTAMKKGGSSGFNITLGGARATDGNFNLIDSYAFYWSATECGENDASCFTCNSKTDNANLSSNSRKVCFSVRLFKD